MYLAGRYFPVQLAALTAAVRRGVPRLLAAMAGFCVAAPGRRYAAAAGATCPRCGQSTGALALLTGRTVYYACAACPHRWSAPAARPRATVR